LSITNALLNIIIILLLIQKYELRGVFIGLSLSTLAMLPFYLKMFFKEFNIKPKIFLKESVVVIALIIFPLILISIVNKIVVYNNYFTLFSKGFMWCLIYWSMLYIFVLDDKDRDIFKGLTRKLCLAQK